MKKLFAVCFIGLTLGTAAFADHPDGWGVGLVGQGAFSGAFGFGPAFSLKAPMLPIYWGISLELRNHYFGLGLTGDFYFLEGLFVPISGSDGFGYFIGVGGYLGFGNFSDEWGWGGHTYKYSWTTLGLGVRVPLGLNVVIPISKIKLEVFIDAAPSIGVGFTFYGGDDEYWNNNDKGGLVGLQWGVGFELGVRVWF